MCKPIISDVVCQEAVDPAFGLGLFGPDPDDVSEPSSSMQHEMEEFFGYHDDDVVYEDDDIDYDHDGQIEYGFGNVVFENTWLYEQAPLFFLPYNPDILHVNFEQFVWEWDFYPLESLGLIGLHAIMQEYAFEDWFVDRPLHADYRRNSLMPGSVTPDDGYLVFGGVVAPFEGPQPAPYGGGLLGLRYPHLYDWLRSSCPTSQTCVGRRNSV
jgi:hypothetical protein